MHGTRAAVLSLAALLVSAVPPRSALRVLAVQTTPGKSHWNFMRGVLGALTDNGHAVTVFTPFPDGDRDNYTEVDTSGDLPLANRPDAAGVFDTFSKTGPMLSFMVSTSREFCDVAYRRREMRRILAGGGGERYDVVLTGMGASDCVSYAARRLDVPLVYLVPSPMITFVERDLLGDAPNPAAVSHVLAGHAVPRTFVQRLGNVVLSAYSAFAVKTDEMALKTSRPSPYDRTAPVTPSVVLVNSRHVADAPRPTTSSVVQVGGVHLRTPETVPAEILEFIERSPHGVIYFAFGSVINMSTLPERILDAFKDALARVPQRVLWKYEGEMKDKPKNVMTSKWFPQRDVLVHPKVKLFISHGGMSGVYEAVDAGVPVLGFPVFFDQPRNIANLVDAGMAISMDLLTVEKESFLKNVVELTNNPKYAENAQIASDRFKDRPMSPAQLVVYWTEYVIRHKGAPHLQSYALNLTWYQYLLLDVFAVLLILIFLTLFVAYKCVRIVYEYVLIIFRNTKLNS